MKLLVIEDDESLREIMTRALRAEGYIVETAATLFSAQDKIAGYNYECILLDIMLPDGSGLQLLRHIKELGKGDRVIIISARDSIDDKVEGLELGADDYLAKPFYMAELLARIRSVLRRGNASVNKVMTAGNISLDVHSRRASIGGNDIPLLKKEFDILLYFLQRPNHIVDKAVLAEAVWGDHVDMADNFSFVYAQVKNLRKKLTEAGATVNIKAVYGFGYKLTESDETNI
ncbi:MAG: response regulator transcription factor [Bacteroidaceae bacterium]|nr:response regulator transcription factor [Bacteroidales bacterium]MBQ3623394.1 response regulator transcription factor [Bacteroidaceae bacterium]